MAQKGQARPSVGRHHKVHPLFLKSCKLQEFGVSLRVRKVQLCANQVHYLGHTVNGTNIRPGPGKTDAVLSMEVPNNVAQLRRFLGAAGYLRRFIRGFAGTARPLFDLLTKDAPWTWSAACQQAWRGLRQALTSEPVLALFDPRGGAVKIECDASTVGLGAVLFQQKGTRWHVVEYASSTFKPHMRRSLMF